MLHFELECRIDKHNIKHNINLFEDIACYKIGGNSYYHSASFGQACALAGDHLDTPDEFSSKFMGKKTSSIASSLKLSLVNSDHFLPHALNAWRTYHKDALKTVASASAKNYPEISISFEQAFFTEAFAQHYLQDSFSSGHMGFNRESSGINASVLFHNEWSNRGRIVADKNSPPNVWITSGDGHLNDREEGYERLVASATNSVESFIYTFITKGKKINNSFPYMIYKATWEGKYLIDDRTIEQIMGKNIAKEVPKPFIDKEWKKNWESNTQIRNPVREAFNLELLETVNYVHMKKAGKSGEYCSIMRISWQPHVLFKPYVGMNWPSFKRDCFNVGVIIPIGTSLDGVIVHSANIGFLRTEATYYRRVTTTSTIPIAGGTMTRTLSYNQSYEVTSNTHYLGYRARLEGIPLGPYARMSLFVDLAPATEDFKSFAFFGGVGVGIIFDTIGGNVKNSSK